jgi:hypothetical protein
MKLFKCTNCGHLLYFENQQCEACGHALGFLPEQQSLVSLTSAGDAGYNIVGGDTRAFRYCANNAYGVCNWLVPAEDAVQLCVACRLNRTIPDLDVPDFFSRWRQLEAAKHRLVYTLLRLKMPLVSQAEDPEKGLAFDFLANPDDPGAPRVLTGHADGLITINIEEGDDIDREMARRAMDEAYRTVLGHFRHEVGHYYWDRLIANTGRQEDFRLLFGDERQDTRKRRPRPQHPRNHPRPPPRRPARIPHPTAP